MENHELSEPNKAFAFLESGENIAPSPKIRKKELVHQNQFNEILKVSVDFGSFNKEYFVREDGDHAGLVVVKDSSILLVRQYRLLINGLSWEIPGGGVDVGETPEEAAIRECFEESGVLCRNIKPLVNFHLGLDTIHNPTYLFHTTDYTQAESPRDTGHEVVGSEWIPLDKCEEMIRSGDISGSFSIIALLAFQAFTQYA